MKRETCGLFAEQISVEDDLRWDLSNGGLENLVTVARACGIEANPDNIRQTLTEICQMLETGDAN